MTEIKYLGNHLQWRHKEVSLKDYYDKFLKKENEGICLNCGKETKFNSYRLSSGYAKCCGYKCSKEYDCVKDPALKMLRSELATKRHIEDPGGFGKGHYKSGWFDSEKNTCEIYYASSYELLAFKILEQMAAVRSYERCKFSIDYINPKDKQVHPYIPDVLVVYADGTKQIIEIKPISLLEDEVNKAKFSAANEQLGGNYLIWTEKDLLIHKGRT